MRIERFLGCHQSNQVQPGSTIYLHLIYLSMKKWRSQNRQQTFTNDQKITSVQLYTKRTPLVYSCTLREILTYEHIFICGFLGCFIVYSCTSYKQIFIYRFDLSR